MLKSDLDELIEFYETEKNNLEHLIDQCIQEMDYKFARYYSKALGQVNEKLRTLKNLDDPFYDSKIKLESLKSFYEKKLINEVYESSENYFKKEISEIENRLHELNQQKSKAILDGQEFDDAIFDLAEGRIFGFKFYLKKELNFYLEFRLIEKISLSISFTPVGTVKDDYVFWKQYLRALKGLGFTFNEENDCLEYIYDLKSFKNSIFLKTFVSRILFDVYYYKDFDNPAYIEYLG